MRLLGAGRPYYSDEWVTLYHADSYAVELPACDLLLTDPPYELTATGGVRVPRGVHRFKTHEEADQWLWRMITRPTI